jgi:hypothetical protein
MCWVAASRLRATVSQAVEPWRKPDPVRFLEAVQQLARGVRKQLPGLRQLLVGSVALRVQCCARSPDQILEIAARGLRAGRGRFVDADFWRPHAVILGAGWQRARTR